MGKPRKRRTTSQLKEEVPEVARPRRDRPSKRELDFVANYLGDGIEAAKAAGITGPTPAKARNNQRVFSYRAMRKPSVRRLIEEKEKALAIAAGRKQGKEMGKVDLIDEVLTLARTPIAKTKGSMHGQVLAYKLIAQMSGHIVEKVEVNDITKRLQNKSADELAFIAAHQRDPVSQEELQQFLKTRKQRVM